MQDSAAEPLITSDTRGDRDREYEDGRGYIGDVDDVDEDVDAGMDTGVDTGMDVDEDTDVDTRVDTGVDESALVSPGLFIWGLTLCAGISGLLFGYE